MITFNTIGKYGRFGNQMFQYATLYSIAKTRNYDFGVPYKQRSLQEYMDFCLPDAFMNLSAQDSSDILVQHKAKERDPHYNAGIFGIPDNTDILGYFQSEKYFVDYRRDLLKEFEFKQEIQEKATSIRSLTKESVISVHLRLGDYTNLSNIYPPCKIEYYEEALSLLPNDLMLFVFSDEPDKAVEFFKNLNKKIVFMENKSKFVDMAVMNMCNYHIIANSSFSWWGSWLSNSSKTIAPAKWLGEDPSLPQNWTDIYCKNWIVI